MSDYQICSSCAEGIENDDIKIINVSMPNGEDLEIILCDLCYANYSHK